MVAEVIKEPHGEWLDAVDNLFTALEIYRDVENQAIGRIKTILAEKGIVISSEDIRKANTESIRNRLRHTREARLREEKQIIREEEQACRK